MNLHPRQIHHIRMLKQEHKFILKDIELTFKQAMARLDCKVDLLRKGESIDFLPSDDEIEKQLYSEIEPLKERGNRIADVINIMASGDMTELYWKSEPMKK